MSDDAAKIVITPADLAHTRDSVIRINLVAPSRPTEVPTPSSSSNVMRPARRWLMLFAIPGLAVVAVAVFFSHRQTVNPDWIESVVSKAERSVVQLDCQQTMGTGTVIAAAGRRVLILTNKHVLTDTAGKTVISPLPGLPCDVLFRSGSRATGQLVGWAKKAEVDLALILTDIFDPPQPLEIAGFDEIVTGKQVIAIGHPLGLHFTRQRGNYFGQARRPMAADDGGRQSR